MLINLLSSAKIKKTFLDFEVEEKHQINNELSNMNLNRNLTRFRDEDTVCEMPRKIKKQISWNKHLTEVEIIFPFDINEIEDSEEI